MIEEVIERAWVLEQEVLLVVFSKSSGKALSRLSALERASALIEADSKKIT